MNAYEKRPTKETYIFEKRPIYLKRDLYTCGKRPALVGLHRPS